MAASSGSFPSKAGRQVAALLLDVGVRNLVPAPPSQISQSLLHQPHISDQREIRRRKGRGLFLFTFFSCAEQTHSPQLQPRRPLSLPRFRRPEGARVRFGTAALRQGFRKALQRVESNPRVRQRLSRRIASGVSLIPCDISETSTHQS